MILKGIVVIVIGFASGVVIAGGIFAFIAIIGVVPRFAQRTKTQKYVSVYEDSIIVGGIFGTLAMYIDFIIPIGSIGTGVYGLLAGIFIGSVAVSIAEVLDVIPILTRRINIKVGMAYLIIALAIGKMIGSLAYWLIPGFAEYK